MFVSFAIRRQEAVHGWEPIAASSARRVRATSPSQVSWSRCASPLDLRASVFRD